MNKTFFLILGILLVLPLVFAQTYQKETNITLKIPFEVNGSAASSSATCNISVNYPNGTYLIQNNSMTNLNNGEFNYTLDSTKTEPLGKYNWVVFCCDGLNCAAGYGSFEVTYTGKILDTQTSILYTSLFAILIFLLMFTLFGITKLPSKDIMTEDNLIIDINKLKYLRPILYGVCWGLLLAIIFIISNISVAYLPDSLIGDFFFVIYSVMFVLTFPMILFLFIYIFYKIFKDKEMKELIERGVQISSTP